MFTHVLPGRGHFDIRLLKVCFFSSLSNPGLSYGGLADIKFAESGQKLNTSTQGFHSMADECIHSLSGVRKLEEYNNIDLQYFQRAQTYCFSISASLKPVRIPPYF